MAQPFWKRWLSHLVELHIESASSEFNPHMYVSLNRGRYQLSTANAVYSFEDLYTNYSRAFHQIQFDRFDIQRILILGFGLGSIPIILEQQFPKSYIFTGIEIDEVVIELVSKYTLPNIQSPLELICVDAMTFVEQDQNEYDLICVDIFFDDTIPEQFEQPAFLLALNELLGEKGLLMLNRLAATSKDQQKSEHFFEETFKKVFPKGTYLDVKGNWMFLNDEAFLPN